MPTFSYPNPIEPLTPADASEIEHNNNELQGYLNTNVITRDGRVAMTAPLLLVDAEPLTDNEATRKAYVDQLLPIGTMMMYGSMNAPAGRWKLCDGSALQTAAFPKLHAVIGYSYGGTGGSFNLPDLRHRVPIGVDTADTRFNAAGKKGGSYEASLLQHKHTITHDHGVFDSGSNSANHKHKITHDHAAFVSADAVIPQLSGEFTAHDAPAAGSSWFARRAGDAGSASLITESGGGTHHHTVNIPSYSGDSSNQDTNHHHAVNVPSFTGDSGNTGVAGVDQIPEFVTVTYIIRTD